MTKTVAMAAKAPGAKAAAKPKVKIVFTHPSSEGPIWPHTGYDFDRRKMELSEMLTQHCPGLELRPVTVMNIDQAKKLLREDNDSDGFLVYMLGLRTDVPMVFGNSGRPCIFADDLYGGSGEFLVGYAAARRSSRKEAGGCLSLLTGGLLNLVDHAAGRHRNCKVAGVSSSRIEDIAEAANCFKMLKMPGGSADAFLAAADKARKAATMPRSIMKCAEDPVQSIPVDACLKKMRSSAILAVGVSWDMSANVKAIENTFGVRVIPIEFKELNQAYHKAGRAESIKWADRWSSEAEKIVEPNPEDLRKSGAMYLAMLDLLKRHKAQAITINCLGGFSNKQITAYPCLGFRQLNDDGFVGACEGDIRSTLTMLVIGALTGRPGFISDPVIDTSKGQIIYCHCLGPTKVFGPGGASNPFLLRNHSEDRKGAAIQSLMPLGYMTTSLEIDCVKREIILHQGKTVENIDEDKACRTKLAAEVKGDIDKLFCEWDLWGWHRVTFYGDIKPEIKALAHTLNFNIVDEA